jgi:hypothetical protein
LIEVLILNMLRDTELGSESKARTGIKHANNRTLNQALWTVSVTKK